MRTIFILIFFLSLTVFSQRTDSTVVVLDTVKAFSAGFSDVIQYRYTDNAIYILKEQEIEGVGIGQNGGATARRIFRIKDSSLIDVGVVLKHFEIINSFEVVNDSTLLIGITNFKNKSKTYSQIWLGKIQNHGVEMELLPWQKEGVNYAHPEVENEVLYFSSNTTNKGVMEVFRSSNWKMDSAQFTNVNLPGDGADKLFPAVHGKLLVYTKRSQFGTSICYTILGEKLSVVNQVLYSADFGIGGLGFINDKSIVFTGYEESFNLYEINTQQFVLERMRSIAGQLVFKKLNGEDAKIYLISEEGEILSEAFIGEDGKFLFKELPSDLSYSFKVEGIQEGEIIITESYSGERSKYVLKNGVLQQAYRLLSPEEALIELQRKTTDDTGQLSYDFRLLNGQPSSTTIIEVYDDFGNLMHKDTVSGDYTFRKLPLDAVSYRLVNPEGEEVFMYSVQGVRTLELKEEFQWRKLEMEELGVMLAEENQSFRTTVFQFRKLSGEFVQVGFVEVYDEFGDLIYREKVNEGFDFRKLSGIEGEVLFKTEENEMLEMHFKETFKQKGALLESIGLTELSSIPGEEIFIDFEGVLDLDPVYVVENHESIVVENGTFERKEIVVQGDIKNGYILRLLNIDDFHEKQIMALDFNLQAIGYFNQIQRNYYEFIELKRDLEVPTIYFGYDSYVVEEKYKQKMVDIAKIVPSGSRIVLKGYTDASGNSDYNKWLSEKRAKQVASILIQNGVPEEQIQIEFYGEEKASQLPEAVNSYLERRVEVVIR